ncbi:hypothetical protein B0J13DRAFT_525479 [Dactylonectria estremocensis]|uniref:Protein kinase domain-containing protein n=1 Tax=Dactylonectria estremocensis TaxID=1079267 RepID=A0A9P9EUQ2_9HYPO|nr:hypothetical protein B0J13DRAFT_525479 [Dactylonectria estremocensis]
MALGIGSDGYMATEILGIFGPDDVNDESDEDGSDCVPTIDMWAVGEMTHRLVTNKVSFKTSRKRLKYVTKAKSFSIEELKNANASSECISFVQNAMMVLARTRLTSK